MSRSVAIPTEEFVWTVLLRRIEDHLRQQKSKLLEHCGLYVAFGPPGPGFTGEQEGEGLVSEITGVVLVSYAQDLVERCFRARSKQKAGRPCDNLTLEVGLKLLDLFLRYHPSAGRISVWTSIDGRLVQEESGPLFEFFKVALKPLNEHLKEMGWKPVSAARAARLALFERDRLVQAKLKRATRKIVS